jgi:PAS domain S-box-containing protein
VQVRVDRLDASDTAAHPHSAAWASVAFSTVNTDEQRLRAILTSLPAMLIAYDRAGVCTIAEGRGLAAFGVRADEVVGKPIDELVHELPRMLDAARRALDGVASTAVVAIGDRILDTYHTPLHDESGAIIGGLGVGIDFTERYHAEKAAQSATRRFHRGVVESPLGMAMTSAGGTYIQVNPAFCAMLGRGEEELIGHHYAEVTPDSEMPYADEVLRRLRDGELNVFQGEKRYTHPTLGIVHVLVNTTAVRDDDGELLYCLHQLTDITERRQMEQALRDSFDRLRKSDAERQRLLRHLVTAQEEERARIAADVHDDSLQALAAVRMRLEMLTTTLDEQQLAKLGRVEADLDGAVARLRKLLFQLRPSALDNDTLGHAIEQLLRESFAGREVCTQVVDSLRSTPPPDIKVVVYRIAQEAVANILKHASASRVEVHLDDHDSGVLVTVRDDGAGFDYEQARRAQLPGHLGLSTMRERAEIAGGWLGIETSPGAGTVVGFWVPPAA